MSGSRRTFKLLLEINANNVYPIRIRFSKVSGTNMIRSRVNIPSTTRAIQSSCSSIYNTWVDRKYSYPNPYAITLWAGQTIASCLLSPNVLNSTDKGKSKSTLLRKVFVNSRYCLAHHFEKQLRHSYKVWKKIAHSLIKFLNVMFSRYSTDSTLNVQSALLIAIKTNTNIPGAWYLFGS